jgi:hypothetical protein
MTRLRPSLAERTRGLRWAIVVVLALAAVTLVAAGVVSVCEQLLSAGGTAVEVCRAPRLDDALTLSFILMLLALLAPDVAEAGVPGLFSLRSRLEAQEEMLHVEVSAREALESRLTAIQAQITRTSAQATVTVVSGEGTARYAAGEDAGQEAAADDGHDPLVDGARYLGAELVLAHLDALGSGSLHGVNLRLYLPDERGEVLSPVLREPVADNGESWRSGEGVVGRAWADNAFVVARGSEVMSGLERLPARRPRYRQLAIVVAVPVRNAHGRPIAVLSASSRDSESGLDSPEAAGDLFGAAAVCARVLVDLLGWASDAPRAEVETGPLGSNPPEGKADTASAPELGQDEEAGGQ